MSGTAHFGSAGGQSGRLPLTNLAPMQNKKSRTSSCGLRALLATGESRGDIVVFVQPKPRVHRLLAAVSGSRLGMCACMRGARRSTCSHTYPVVSTRLRVYNQARRLSHSSIHARPCARTHCRFIHWPVSTYILLPTPQPFVPLSTASAVVSCASIRARTLHCR